MRTFSITLGVVAMLLLVFAISCVVVCRVADGITTHPTYEEWQKSKKP